MEYRMIRISIVAVLVRTVVSVSPGKLGSIILLLATGVALPAAAQELPPAGLAEFVGKDLQRLDDIATLGFRNRYEKLTGERLPLKGDLNSTQPRWVKPFASGPSQWAMVATNPGYSNPGFSDAKVDVFDKNWKRIATEGFLTGYRLHLRSVDVDEDNPLKQPVLVAKLIPTSDLFVEDRNAKIAREKRQYYALAGERWVTVRFEKGQSQLVRTSYAGRVTVNGPQPPKRTKDEWITQLKSENAVEQLAALVWLSGRHLRSTDRRNENTFEESIEDSRLFESVRDADEMASLLNKLTMSENSWVRDAARLALQTVDE